MNGSKRNHQPWAILLAGGEGKRLSSLTLKITGEPTPKQFCALLGRQSLLEQTRERVSLLVEEDHILTALTQTQERFYKPIADGSPSHNLVIQPRNRGTGPAILYALLRLAQLDPAAQVGLFPCDHFVDDDREFMRHVQIAFEAVTYRPELTVLLGIAADRAESSYGWIEPGKPVGPGQVVSVRQFWEKPHPELAGELLRRGCLWNSFVIVARVSTLIGLFMIAMPSLYRAFEKVRTVFGSVVEDDTVRRLYDRIAPSNFSDDVLTRHGVNLGVLPVDGVQWNDLGEPHRVAETLRRLGIRHAWQAA
jgi:mannose-1-phosphate guanylyltransferase